MPTQKLTSEIITAAIEGFEAQKRRIDEQIGELRAMLPSTHSETTAIPSAPPKGKRRLSAAGRRRIAEATKKRWAAFHAAEEAALAKKSAPKKPAVEKAAARKSSAKKAARKSR